MKQAIQKAIEGGWKYENYPIARNFPFTATLDPTFWQALGKAMGWTKKCEKEDGFLCHREYRVYWHRFIDHLAEGKDVESFFTDLLANKN